jgi:cytochrome b pre-mRNA-processing protein 3
VIELSQQFNAAIIGYDEGIQSDDKILAGALWRRLFNLECNNPEHLETLLIYVRKQVSFVV